LLYFPEPKTRYNEGEVNIHYKTPIRREEKEYIPEEELRRRQEDQVHLNKQTGDKTKTFNNNLFLQMRKFYEEIEQKKEHELRLDMQNRKHHDTLLPTQKSPIPLNRYEDFSGGDSSQQVITPQSTLSKNINTHYKMVSRALYNFQVDFLFWKISYILGIICCKVIT
jgi:sorbin and SH3 domain-containing protein 1